MEQEEVYNRVLELPLLLFGIEDISNTDSLKHKIPDRLSLPDYLLLAGPCMAPDITHAYRVRPDKVKSLLKLLITEIDKDIDRTGSTLEDRDKEEAEMYYNEMFGRSRFCYSRKHSDVHT